MNIIFFNCNLVVAEALFVFVKKNVSCVRKDNSPQDDMITKLDKA